MNWYYALGGQQAGPVTEEELTRLASSGVINGTTLVWRDGLADWQALSVALPGLVTAGDVPVIGGVAVAAGQKDLLVQQMREGVLPMAPGGMRYAGFWIRVLARIIDGIIVQAVMFFVGLILGLVAGGKGGADNAVSIIILIISIGLALGYEIFMVGKYSATLGKMALGLKVVRADGSRVSMGLSAGRYFAQILSALILYIGYIMVAFDQEKRALHDQICGTRVIQTR